tara:strand:- start:196 stop:456 length:261 start_codon:yes stop_codon:yes gene_type:complete
MSQIPGTEVTTAPGLLQETDANVIITTQDDTIHNVPVGVGHDHSEILAKLDDLSAKVDHLLEHMHQPMTGTLTIDCPPKTPAGLTT